MIVEEIKESKADIICFQEFCDEDYFEEELTPLGYTLCHQIIHNKIHKGSLHGVVDHGLAIAYKTDKFTMNRVEKVDFMDLALNRSYLLKRQQQAMLCQLKTKKG